jgi:hypothetical protein
MPQNFPEEIQQELNRRKTNRSFHYIDGAKGEWDDDTGEWTKYKGPMVPWIRFASNGAGRVGADGREDKQGFVFSGGKNFYDGYGFVKNSSGSMDSIIGYMPNGTPHIIDNDIRTSNYPIHVPTPEIEKINVTIQKELFRRASVEWVCFSKKQLEYMTPYFLIPGITCILEWGWNHYDPTSLLRLDRVDELKKLNDNPYPLYTEHILKSKGNYDVLFGKITHFEWFIEGNKIRCKTEITSQDRIYAGLVVDANSVDQVRNPSGQETDIRPLNNLTQFVDEVLTKMKGINTNKTDPTPELRGFLRYLQEVHPKNWKEYWYGVFYGRDPEDTKRDTIPYDNKKEDFDRKAPNQETWINLGLLMEAINFNTAPLKSFKNRPMFRVDIDDCVISGHPNLISTDGSVLLIPNAEAPKYFSGRFGFVPSEARNAKEVDYKALDNINNPLVKVPEKKEDAAKQNKLADFHLFTVCKQRGGARRDNLDEVINKIRYENNPRSLRTFEFPFLNDTPSVPGSKDYPRRYSGLLRNLYFNVGCLQDMLKNNSDIKTYPQLIEKILEKISDSAGNFWDFRLVSGTGRSGLGNDELATMKIADYRFVSTSNRGTPYSFDYFDADSLLQGIGFKPTLSNAQAIRTIYAQTNNPDKKTTLTNGENELLDYKFRDRLFLDEDKKVIVPVKSDTSQFDERMRELQQISPVDGTYQVTSKNQVGFPFVRRLVLPAPDILRLLLDDDDEENNPKYTGIMPGIQATFTLQGIGGLRTFMMFLVRNLPEPYSHQNIVFRIVDVQETVESGRWTTVITAGVIPLREQIKNRLGFNSKTN